MLSASMSRLQAELQRLYLPHDARPEGPDVDGDAVRLVDADGRVRAMVVELAQQAGWAGVAALWQGVQDDLDLPAPAIAVSGVDGYQLWFSLAEPVPLAQALAFLESLRQRYLGAIAAKHLRIKPLAEDLAFGQDQHVRRVPSVQGASGHWSAFVAPGLAGMFADEPWLDMPPSPEAQAKLLSQIASIQPAEFQLARQRLRPTDAPVGSASESVAADVPRAAQDPKRFLLAVMNDPTIPMSLRIEAAKALLPHHDPDESPSHV
jgi:hypothetical protein